MADTHSLTRNNTDLDLIATESRGVVKLEVFDFDFPRNWPESLGPRATVRVFHYCLCVCVFVCVYVFVHAYATDTPNIYQYAH